MTQISMIIQHGTERIMFNSPRSSNRPPHLALVINSQPIFVQYGKIPIISQSTGLYPSACETLCYDRIRDNRKCKVIILVVVMNELFGYKTRGNVTEDMILEKVKVMKSQKREIERKGIGVCSCILRHGMHWIMWCCLSSVCMCVCTWFSWCDRVRVSFVGRACLCHAVPSCKPECL